MIATAAISLYTSAIRTDEAEESGAHAANLVTEVEETRGKRREGDGEAEPREDWVSMRHVQVRSLAKNTLGSTRTGSAMRLPAVRCRSGCVDMMPRKVAGTESPSVWARSPFLATRAPPPDDRTWSIKCLRVPLHALAGALVKQ